MQYPYYRCHHSRMPLPKPRVLRFQTVDAAGKYAHVENVRGMFGGQ